MRRSFYLNTIVFFVFMTMSLKAQHNAFFEVSIDTMTPPICSPAIITFTDNSYIDNGLYNGVVNRSWQIDGFYLGEDSIVTDTLGGGNHMIRLEIFDDAWNPLATPYVREIYIDGSAGNFEIKPSNIVCPGTQIELNYWDETNSSVTWELWDGTKAFGQSKMFQMVQEGSFDVTAIVKSPMCPTDTIKKTIEVNSGYQPQLFIHHSAQTVCPGDIIQFDAPEFLKDYQFDFGDGQSANKAHALHSYSTEGTYTVTLTASSPCGVQASTSTTIDVVADQPTEARFDFYFDGSACPYTPVRFVPHGAASAYKWYFGDGDSSTLRNPVHQYDIEGDFPVTLIVESGCGNRDTITNSLYISKTYETIYSEVWFEVRNHEKDDSQSELNICPGEVLYFDNMTGDQSLKYEWYINGVPYGNKYNFSYTFDQPGNFTVELRAFDNCGGEIFTTRSVYVDPAMMPQAQLVATPLSLCPGGEVFFRDDMLYDSDAFSNIYHVDFGDGQSQNNISDFSDEEIGILVRHKYNNPGQYPAFMVVENACQIKDTMFFNVQVVNDAAALPNYYVTNSTQSQDDENMHVPDFGIAPDGIPFHQIDLNTYWPNWTSEYANEFYVFYFYGEIMPEQEPDGFTKIKTDYINEGDNFIAYVPVRVDKPQSVSLIFGWYCDTTAFMDNEPEVIEYVTQSAIPLVNGGWDILPQYQVTSPLPQPGSCLSGGNELTGSWEAMMPNGNIIELDIYDNTGIINHDLRVVYMNTNQGQMDDLVSSGEMYSVGQNKLDFYGYNGICNFSSDSFSYTLINDTLLTFNLLAVISNCDARDYYLTFGTFKKRLHDKDFGDERAACPGDPVRFYGIGGTSVKWLFPDGTTKYGEKVEHSFTTIGTKQVKAIFTNGCNRTDTMITEAIVGGNSLPVPWFRYEKVDGPTSAIKFIYEGEGVIQHQSYLWNFGDGSSSTEIHPVHTYSQAGNYNVKLRVGNGCGFSEEYRQVFATQQVEPCSQTIGIDTINISANTVRFITSIEPVSNAEYFWRFGDGTSSNEPDPVHTFNWPGWFNVCLTLSDPDNNCVSNYCHEMFIGETECLANFTYEDMSTQTEYIFDFTGNAQNANVYQWNFSDGGTSNLQNPTHQFDEPGFYEVCLNVVNTTTECSNDICKVIQIQGSETYCDGYFDYIVEDRTVFFNAMAMPGEPVQLFWKFGNGKVSQAFDPEMTYQKYGTFTVCLTVVDTLTGCQNEYCEEIIIGQPECKASFSFSVDAANTSVTLTNTSPTVFTDLFWELGNGSFSADNELTYTYNKSGVYTVCLQGFESATGCVAQMCKDIIIPSVVNVVPLKSDFGSFVNPVTRKISLTDKSMGNPEHWYWIMGDGKVFEDTSAISYIYQAPGLYNVCLIVEDADGQVSKTCKSILIGNAQCNVDADFKYMVKPNTQEVVFSDNSTGDYSKYFWDFGNGKSSTVSNPTHMYTKPGYYLVKLAVSNEVGTCSDAITKLVQVGITNCRAAFDFNVDAQNKVVSFTNNSQGSGLNYYWYFGNGKYSVEANPVHTYTKPGFYYVSLTVSKSDGTCADFTVSEVQVGDVNCKATFTVYVDSTTQTAYFKPEIVNNNLKYFWIFGDGQTSFEKTPDHRYNVTGFFTPELRVATDDKGCMDSYSQTILIGEEGRDCEADFYYMTDGKKVNFIDKSIGDNLTYYWHFNFGDTVSSVQNAEFEYPVGGYYNVCLTVENNQNVKNTMCKKIFVDDGIAENCHAEFEYMVDSSSNQVDYLDFSSGNINDWIWPMGDGDTLYEQNPTHVYADTGFYSAGLLVRNTLTGCLSRKFVLVDVNSKSDKIKAGFVQFEVDDPGLKRVGKPVDFVSTSSGRGGSYSWSVSARKKAGSVYEVVGTSTPRLIFYENGLYDVCLTITDDNLGVSDTYCEVVKIEGITSVEDNEFDKLQLSVYPSPFENEATITFDLDRQSRVAIKVYNSNGQLVEVVKDELFAPQSHVLTWNTDKLNSGTYFIRFESEGNTLGIKPVVKK